MEIGKMGQSMFGTRPHTIPGGHAIVRVYRAYVDVYIARGTESAMRAMYARDGYGTRIDADGSTYIIVATGE